MEKILVFAIVSLAVTADCYKSKYFSQSLDTEPSLSILYARDKKSDKITNECLMEMYPRNLYKYPLRIDRNDVPCIIHCVLKKFGIMTNDGHINIKNYYRRVQAIHRYDPRVLISDVGETCAQNINGMNLDHDVCKKAKVFNDCTQLYAITFREEIAGRLLLLTVLLTAAECRISVMYAHDKLSDLVAQQCFTEMYPKNKQIEIQESDEPCLIFCVLRKLGIMSSSGQIILDNYRKRVQIAHQLDQRILTNDFGSNCVESAEATQHKQDVCKKAKVFNDCTHLYRILLK